MFAFFEMILCRKNRNDLLKNENVFYTVYVCDINTFIKILYNVYNTLIHKKKDLWTVVEHIMFKYLVG